VRVSSVRSVRSVISVSLQPQSGELLAEEDVDEGVVLAGVVGVIVPVDKYLSGLMALAADQANTTAFCGCHAFLSTAHGRSSSTQSSCNPAM
jgi:hypothetical protein